MIRLKFLLLPLVLLFLATGASAQLYFRNNTRETVLVACALKRDPKALSSWFSKGWFIVKPGDRVPLQPTVGPFNLFYYYAQSVDGKKSFDGTMRLWVEPYKRFTIEEPEKMDTWKGHASYQQRLFRVVRLPQGAIPKEYTVEFKG